MHTGESYDSSLHADYCVKGGHGPLIDDPNPNIKHCVHQKAIGTIIRSTRQIKWAAVFYFHG